MKSRSRPIILAAVLLLTAGCDQAVKHGQNVTYVITGNPQSMLYPMEVKQDSEDVRIRLKKNAPVPEIISLDFSGHAVAFNFTANGDILVVPGKFGHLRLRREGAETVDIFVKPR